LPFQIKAEAPGLGLLQGHLSRANTHWRTLDGADVLVVFQGPDAYISPSWYASKAAHGKVVPTWNYAMVQVRGVARVLDDERWLRDQITRLTSGHEESREVPWHVTDAPSEFIEAQIRGIVGVEIAIQQIDGKWKVSQNRPVEDRGGVVAGLEKTGASAMAALVRDRTMDE
jgi:transcriptional regulator